MRVDSTAQAPSLFSICDGLWMVLGGSLEWGLRYMLSPAALSRHTAQFWSPSSPGPFSCPDPWEV